MAVAAVAVAVAVAAAEAAAEATGVVGSRARSSLVHDAT